MTCTFSSKLLVMKSILFVVLNCLLCNQVLIAQSTIVHEKYTDETGKLWSMGFLIAFIIGLVIYLLIKKNLKKDASR